MLTMLPTERRIIVPAFWGRCPHEGGVFLYEYTYIHWTFKGQSLGAGIICDYTFWLRVHRNQISMKNFLTI